MEANLKQINPQQIIDNLVKNGWKEWKAPNGRKYYFKTIDYQNWMVWEYKGKLYLKLKKSYIITSGARFTNSWEQIGIDAGLFPAKNNLTRRERAERMAAAFVEVQ